MVSNTVVCGEGDHHIIIGELTTITCMKVNNVVLGTPPSSIGTDRKSSLMERKFAMSLNNLKSTFESAGIFFCLNCVALFTNGTKLTHVTVTVY